MSGLRTTAMRFLLVLWITICNAFEAVVWATLFWAASESFFDVEWIYLFWIFFVVFFFGGLGAMGAEPWPMLGIDPMLVGLAIMQAATNGSWSLARQNPSPNPRRHRGPSA